MDSDDEQPKRNTNRDEEGGVAEEQESFLDKMKRMTTNCCQATGLCCFKFKEQSQISGLEYKITNRQKKFGVDYLTLVEEKASQDALKKCLREALGDIAEIQREINSHHDKIDSKKAEVDEKIKTAPASSKRSSKPKPVEEEKSEEDQPAGDSGAQAPKKKKKKKKKPAEPKDENFSIDDE